EALPSWRRGPASPAAPTAPRSAVSTTPTALRPRGIAAPPHRGPAAPRYRRPVRQSTSPVHPTPGLFNERNIMRALVYQGPYEVAVQDVEDPAIQDPSDVIVRITTSAICGSDLHMYEGRTDAEPGITFGHEHMGVIEEVGPGVTSLSKGDRVVLPFNVACGFCTNCRRGKSAFCLTVNEPGTAGGAYGYVGMGPYPGGQAEYLRVPFADYNCVPLPAGTEHESDFALLADIFPTGYHGVELSGMQPGDTIAVYGAGPVGQM